MHHGDGQHKERCHNIRQYHVTKLDHVKCDNIRLTRKIDRCENM